MVKGAKNKLVKVSFLIGGFGSYHGLSLMIMNGVVMAIFDCLQRDAKSLLFLWVSLQEFRIFEISHMMW